MPHPTPWLEFEALVDLLRDRQTVVLSGAGVSTESGIPDYRGPNTRDKEREPIRHDAFVGDAGKRQHYWARSAIGWPSFREAVPNAGHRALARLEEAGHIRGIITQNVDRLHQKAGSSRVVELHGALADVRCLSCRQTVSREAVQETLLDANPGWTDRAAAVAPDGDADLPRSVTRDFSVPACSSCDGVLKPDVVFFGGRVPAERVDAAWSLLGEADVLLVTGSSLTVYSGYRFVRHAAETGRPVGIVNLGNTRGDDLAQVHVEGRTGAVLPALSDALGV
jgi:NAD-dependent SIR2 family protein deacetylase